MTETAERPTIRLLAGHAKRLRGGHPWVFSNEIAMDAAAKAIEPGTLARVIDAGGEALACATFNPHSLIAARVVDHDAGARFDAAAIAGRLARARDLRDRLVGAPYYRLVHAAHTRAGDTSTTRSSTRSSRGSATYVGCITGRPPS